MSKNLLTQKMDLTSSPFQGDTKHADRRCPLGYNSPSSVSAHHRRSIAGHFGQPRLRAIHCSWKCTAIVFVLFSLALLVALTYCIVSALRWQYTAKTPCPVMIGDLGLVVENSRNPSSLPSKTLPPAPESFSEVQVGRTYGHRIPPFGHWNLQLPQRTSAFVRFNYSLPEGASVGVYGRRNGVPSHTRFDFVEILNSKDKRRVKTGKDQYFMEFVQFLEEGLWFISVYNDGNNSQEVLYSSLLTDEASLPCPYDCHGQGTCIMGTCVCDSEFGGESCSNRMCPVVCSGRGKYSGGECVCSPGWKGKECHLREDECEVPDCSGHGDCVDGLCHCFPGYKGEHCDEIDCLDPTCSQHGVCVRGTCLCRRGWKGADCSEQDGGPLVADSSHCQPDCSGRGSYDPVQHRCLCEEGWTGPDCSQENCELDCGAHGRCHAGQCHCMEGWTGTRCTEKLCDARCLEHGECKNGSCLCIQGWNGKHCTLDGCPKNCNGHGECVATPSGSPLSGGVSWREWRCRCSPDWAGSDCSIPLERSCGDRVDNDGDGLVDCADSECCADRACEDSPLCLSSADPLDILLRKQPPAVTASFFQRMQFLIEEDSVQSYAHKNSFNDSMFWNHFNASRAAVVRGQVVSTLGSPLKGIRVAVATDPFFGFTITRDTGWFDMMVNGGGAVTLQFHREPFRPMQKTVMVPWNEIVVMDRIVMASRDGALNQHGDSASSRGVCLDHDYDAMSPVVLATWTHGFQGGCPDRSLILAESQVIQETLGIPGTNLHLVYHSSRAGGYLATIQLQLTPDAIPTTLRRVHLRITIEGILFERSFEADPAIKFTYAWNRRNVYRQKVFGVAMAIVSVGYEYSTCSQIVWVVQTTRVSGHDMSVSEIGGWNLDIHHQYNFHEGILQKGDGTNLYLKARPRVLVTTMGDGQQRAMHCPQCGGGPARQQRLLAPVALASGPDGSLYVGDFNLIRRIAPDGTVDTVVELSAAQVAYRYHLAVGPADGRLYVSDPERHQIFRAISLAAVDDPRSNLEPVVGSAGAKCLPGDKALCGDGRPARDAKLAYPKGIAISAKNEMYIADGTNIRYVDPAGIIHTLVGDHYHNSHWKPFPCGRTPPLSQVHLRWPTELAISPLDGSLHILDDHLVLRITQDRRIKVVAGKPVQCSGPKSNADKSDKATDEFLESPQSIAFSSNGDLYIAESDSQMINRVRVVYTNGKIAKYVGADLKCSCMDVNCRCIDEDHYLASTSKLNTISSITVSHDGVLHLCDQGNLRLRSVKSLLPFANDFNEYEIHLPETQEIYIFNRHGHHISTKNILTGKAVYTFSYNVNTSFGKLSTVTDAAGNKLFILRDYNNQVNTIENTQGGKCRLEMSRMRMLQSFTTPDNFKTTFEYHGSNGLLRSKTAGSRQSYMYSYDAYGRLVQAVTPSGQSLRLAYSLSARGATVDVSRDGKPFISFTIRGPEVASRVGNTEERLTLRADGGLSVVSRDSSTREIETVPSPVLEDPAFAETFPVPARVRTALSDDVIQRFEWRYYLRREGKARTRSISQVGRKMKVNGETLVSIDFDRKENSETVYDKNQIPLLRIVYNDLGHPIELEPSQNLTPVQLKYNKFGRLSKWEHGYLQEHYSFDIQGRLSDIFRSDNSGIMFKYEEGPISLPTEIILPSGSRYLLQYDPSGSLQAIITPNGHKHEIATQTSLGFYKLLYISPGVKFPYVLHYNDQGQILAKYYPKNRGRVVYIYSDSGKLTKIICGAERTDIHYYERHLLVKYISKSVPGLDSRVDFRYHGSLLKEERHRFHTRSGLDGAKYKYQYDGRLNQIEVEINGKGTSEMKYKYNSDTGTMEQMQQFLFHRPKINSIFIQDDMRQYSKTISIDSYGRIVVLAVTLWNKEIYSLGLNYDNRSRVKQARMKIGRDGEAKITNYTYTVDGFLEEVEGEEIWKFIYDINGNMKSIRNNNNQMSLRYDEGDRLIGYGDVELYLIDARGFVIQRGQEKFIFNAEGHLTHAFEQHQYEINYFYDSNGRLIARKDHRGNVTQFLYANPLNPSLVTHVHLPQEATTYCLFYDSNSHLMYIQQGAEKFYVATDHLGTPMAIFNSDGDVIKGMSYTPFGKLIKDTNPDFHLPIDFQGGIRDPLTHLVHFQSRVYDPQSSQWLTPQWENLPNLLDKPYNIHLYRFNNNDPINKLQDNNHLTELKDWLAALGFDMDKIMIQPKTNENKPFPETLPVVSGLGCISKVIESGFRKYSTVPKTDIRVSGNFLRTINSRIANLPSVLGDGILLSNYHNRAIVHILGDASPILKDVITSVFNDTFMLDIHSSLHGRDSFYFVQEDKTRTQQDWDQLQRLGNMYNITMHTVEPLDTQTSTGLTDLRLQSTNVVLNIRYGTNLAEERLRLIRYWRQKAIEEAWLHELEQVQKGHRGSVDWTKQEKDELLANGFVSKYRAIDIHDPEHYPLLADDPTNIKLSKENSRKRRGKPKRPK